jgi:uncharacterized protein YcfJ
MRSFILSLSAVALVMPAAVALPSAADARKAKTYRNAPQRHYRNCRHSPGTTGLIAGGVGGAIIGDKVIGGGIAGPIVGAVGGALAGRAIDRTITADKRCR